MFMNPVIIDGQGVGTWRPAKSAGRLVVDVIPLRRFAPAERRALSEVAAGYGRFLGVPVSVSIA